MLAESATRSITRVGHLWLDDFRCLQGVDLELDPGLTVIHGANGQGKTSMLEAIAWIARSHSFRGVSDAPLVRNGSRAGDRARRDHERRPARNSSRPSCARRGRNRVQCNKRAITRARDLHGLLRVAVFAPDDLELVKGGPGDAARVSRRAARDARGSLRRRARRLRTGVETTQRVAALGRARSVGRRDARRARRAARARGRASSCAAGCNSWTGSGPAVNAAYAALAEDGRPVAETYEAEWAPEPLGIADTGAVDELLRAALVARRRAEIDRGVTLVGPAPRRLEADDRRARRAHPGVAGRAAQPRARVAPGGPGSRARAHRHAAGAAPRRRVQRARRPPVERARSATCRRARRC